jgi:hypothetical protein
VEKSILKSTKKILGIAPDYLAFDLDVITHINSVFVTLAQLGIGPEEGFMIEDDTTEWEEFLGPSPLQNSVKSYMHLRCRLLFDPPATSFHLASMEKQVQELEYRMNVQRESIDWVDPNPTVLVSDWAPPFDEQWDEEVHGE